MPGSKRSNTRQSVEVAIAMQYLELVPDGAGGDQAIDTGAHGQPGATRGSIQLGGMIEDARRHGRLDNRQRPQRLLRERERPLIVEPLQDFLDDWQARHDVVEVDRRLKIEAGALPEDLDPDRRVNEHHGLPCANAAAMANA